MGDNGIGFSWLKEWQTLIGAVLALGAAALTIRKMQQQIELSKEEGRQTRRAMNRQMNQEKIEQLSECTKYLAGILERVRRIIDKSYDMTSTEGRGRCLFELGAVGDHDILSRAVFPTWESPEYRRALSGYIWLHTYLLEGLSGKVPRRKIDIEGTAKALELSILQVLYYIETLQKELAGGAALEEVKVPWDAVWERAKANCGNRNINISELARRYSADAH